MEAVMKHPISILLTFLMFFVSFSSHTFSQTEIEQGIILHNQGKFEEAIKYFKKISKEQPQNVDVLYYLGFNYLQIDEPKNAKKVLEKALKINDADARIYTYLAYSYIKLKDLPEAQKQANKALELDSEIAEAHYVLGIISYSNESYNYSYARAKKATELLPNFAPAYLLKAESLISSFGKQGGTVIDPPEMRVNLLSEAADDLEKYVNLIPNNEESKAKQEYLKSVKFFAEYYSKPKNTLSINLDEKKEKSYDTNIKIHSQPHPSFTNRARSVGISGKIILAVEFSETGKVENVLVLKSLGYGLDEKAIEASRSIKFEPAKKNGEAVSVVKRVEYSFTVY